MYNLSFLHAPLAVSLADSKCSHILCLPRLQRHFSGESMPAARVFFAHYPFLYPSKGVWGLAPMLTNSP